ncbi:hypothetical protein BC835DRAFT_262110 [Cytidiella melzeri]|nr:hypothetical protein BC835DRAFT_262110 [Cytidiella melzeri]
MGLLCSAVSSLFVLLFAPSMHRSFFPTSLTLHKPLPSGHLYGWCVCVVLFFALLTYSSHTRSLRVVAGFLF